MNSLRFKNTISFGIPALMLSISLIADEIKDLEALGLKLKAAVSSGVMTEAEAIEEWFRVAEQSKKDSKEEPHNFPENAFEYAKLVEPELGVPPKVNLDESVEIPLFVNGKRKFGNLGRKLDNPSYLGKSTVSGSTLQRYQGRTAKGEPMSDVVWVSFGRNSSHNHRKVIGSVQMIGYNYKTGATAFFESSDNINPWVKLDKGTLRMRGTLPGIDHPDEFNKAFVTPRSVQCVQCHQNDPFIHNPFIDAALIPGSKKTVVPKLDEDSPYYVIGGENWDMRTMHIKGNACFDCHRVGMKTVELFLQNGWEPNAHMPPNKPGSLADDLRELLDVWVKGPENVIGAEWVVPPARGKPSQVVYEKYPHKSGFNTPNKKLLTPSRIKALEKSRTLKNQSIHLLRPKRSPAVVPRREEIISSAKNLAA